MPRVRTKTISWPGLLAIRTVAKAIFEQGRPVTKSVRSKNLKRLEATGLKAPRDLVDIRFTRNGPNTDAAVVGLKYPRGYTPSRMEEIDKLTRKPKSDEARPLLVKGEPYQSAQFKEVLARSNIKASSINNLSVDTNADDLPEGVRGQYDPSPYSASGSVKLAPINGKIHGAVALHEIGHHIDRSKRPHIYANKENKSAEDFGTGEAEADKIAAATYRHDPRKPIASQEDGQHSSYAVRTAVAQDLSPTATGSGIHAEDIARTHQRAKEFAAGYASRGAIPAQGNRYWGFFHDYYSNNPTALNNVSKSLSVPPSQILDTIGKRK